jgi:hypothetical protein
MSRVSFHSQHGEAEVRGPERAYAGGVCNDLFAAVLGPSRFSTDEQLAQYRALFPEGHYIRTIEGDHRYIRSAIETALAVGQEFFTETLNTALIMGSDPVKLLARLHGQCEIHAYVEGPDRAWLAGIIERGRTTKVLRAEMGWEGVVALLRARDDSPVVTSYSVCERFPNGAVAGWTDNQDGEGWYDLPPAEQWTRALAGIRAERGLRLMPDDWDGFYFGDGETAFDLLERVRSAPPPPEDRP